ncbi:MAG: hypothetical protein NZO58_04380 [Gemmataceae bacterium]|nr:hypothetical protein [Gemmataceae bacterium]
MVPTAMMCALLMGQVPELPKAAEGPSSVRTPATGPAVLSPTTTTGVQPQPELWLDQVAKQEPRTTTIVGTPYPFMAPSDEPAQKFSGSVTLNQDSFFGFYPILNGSYAITDKCALTFYGLFWTNPGFTPSGTTGTGLWTEVAAGISFPILDGAVSVNPAVGFLNGALLSSADRANAFEGIVSQISFSHAAKYTEGQLFMAYYAATSAPSNNNFLHWWVTAGLRPWADNTDWTQIVSAGVHFEQLYRTKAEIGEARNIYSWLGPYLQVTLPNNAFLRVNAGWDLQDLVSGTFYKATIGYAF